MFVKAQGQLRHRFWGTYSAVIALVFADEHQAKSILSKLGKGWSPDIYYPKVLKWVGNSEELEECKRVLGSLGADVTKIDSLTKSVDYGEPFEIQADIIPPEQMNLFG